MTIPLGWVRMAIGAVLVAALSFAGYSIDKAFNERDALRLENSSLIATVANLQASERATSIVLSNRVQSKAAIAKRSSDVQVEIERRLPDADVCTLPPSWRVLHDTAAENAALPPATGGADATPASPKEALSTVADNYATYHDVADQLRALQQWIKEVSK